MYLLCDSLKCPLKGITAFVCAKRLCSLDEARRLGPVIWLRPVLLLFSFYTTHIQIVAV